MFSDMHPKTVVVQILILPQVIKNPDPGDPLCCLRGDHQPPASEGGGIRELRGGGKVKLAKQKFHTENLIPW